MSINIKKARLGRGNTLEVSYTDGEGNEITLKGKNIVHSDLKKRLADLVPYLADLTEQREANEIDWNVLDCAHNVDLLKRLEVTGVTYGDNDSYPTATMTGKRTLYTSKVLNICAPTVCLNEGEDWEHTDDFRDAVHAFLYEAELYVTDRKWSVVQQQIEFGEGDDPFEGGGEPTQDAPIEGAA